MKEDEMGVMFPDLEAMLTARRVVRRSDGSFAEDSYDYGVWWRDPQARVYRLTWIGAQMREDAALAGELYLVRLSGPHVGTVSLSEISSHPDLSIAPVDYVSAGDASGMVELLCVIPPLGHDLHDDPPAALTEMKRKTCGRCGKAWIVRPDGSVYGSAVGCECIDPDENVERILDGWAEICGLPSSTDWLRDRVREALEAGWAKPARIETPHA